MYGYTNGVMYKGKVIERIGVTIEQFLTYLQDDRKIKLGKEEIDYIKSMKRMRKLLHHKIEINSKDNEVGKEFLLGDNGTGKYSRDIIWEGIIPDINNDGSPGMTELKETLVEHRSK